MDENRKNLIESISKIIEKSKENYLDVLRDLVKIPSVSAWEDPEPRHEVASYIVKKMENVGISSKILEGFDKDYPIVLAMSPQHVQPPRRGMESLNKRRIILFMGHLDVQPPGDLDKWKENPDPFNPIVKEGRIYGRGILDTKAQVAAQICALMLLNELSLPPRPLDFIFTTDEEIGSQKSTLDFFKTQEKLYKPINPYIGAINGENSGERVVLGCKGIIKVKFTARDPLGRGHSGKSMFHQHHPILNLSNFFSKIREKSEILHDGLNTLNPPVRIIEDLEEGSDEFEKIDGEIILPINGLKIALGKEIWNHLVSQGWNVADIGKKFASISFNPDNFLSGTSESQTIVPDEAISEVDLRLPPKVDPGKVINILEEEVDYHPHINMEVLMPSSPEHYRYFQGAFTSPYHRFVKSFVITCSNIQGKKPVIMPFSSGTSDDRFLEALHVPHVKFGAIGKNNHGYDEWVSISSYLNVIKIYSLMMIQQ
ncbi:MAG: M20 family metallopeptidase [Candidatus Hodarchaeota archaeon]